MRVGLAINEVRDFIDESDDPGIQSLKGDRDFENNIGLVVGIVNGMLEMLPITSLLNRNPAGKTIKRKILKGDYEECNDTDGSRRWHRGSTRDSI